MMQIIGIGLVALSLVMTCIYLLKKNEPFLDLRCVIVNHLKLFERSPRYYIVFYFIPLLFAVGLSLVYKTEVLFFKELSIILGILLSMLMAMLSILCGYNLSTVKDKNQRDNGKKGIEDTANAIVFTCILIICLLLLSFVVIVVSGTSIPPFIYSLKPFVSGIAYYVFFVILLNLLLVIKNMTKIISYNLIVIRTHDNDPSDKEE